MKAEIELSVDERTGMPVIKFRHYTKEDNIEQKLLDVFIKKAAKGGLEFLATGGTICNKYPFSTYEIRVKDSERVKISLDSNELLGIFKKSNECNSTEQKIIERIEQLERDIVIANAIGEPSKERLIQPIITELKCLLSHEVLHKMYKKRIFKY